ncbi:MAG TPA: acyl-[ACP]--phospholipid O-acyltransferase [Stellaceae bacterium]|jgi:acyl-[acyl-carrier-protein]-phospholipid O-acyltransferase/long-chain-fatty-acid--[acyl-carrier-protein] ligase|nr:acyl-[ACP]--phospholipid O-acyltransferase [Stellaceae bacterium]
MAETQLHLLKSRRFLPLFVTQFLGAVNDNLLKTALVTLVTYRAFTDPTTTKIVVAIATATFIAPYFLASATAGQLADKFEKAGLVRYVKLWEIGVMLLAVAGFALGGEAFVYFELAVLFLLGVQATFFGPVKYGILPDLLAPEELMGGNALIEAGTFLAILLGTIAGGLLILAPGGETIVSAALLAIAVGGWGASRFIPRAGRAAPELRINPNIWAETMAILRFAGERRELRLAILAISWFWLVGAIFLSQFPTYAKGTLGADASVETLFLAMFSVGIGAGAVLCGRLLRGEVSARLAPLGALGMCLFAIDLYAASSGPAGGSGGALIGVGGFLARPANWRITGDLFMIALSGGLFTVPLYALLQARSEESHRSRVVAANNVLNALFIVASGAVSAVMLKLGLSVPAVFLVFGILNAAAAVFVLSLAPEVIVKGLLAALLRLLYRVEVSGRENYDKAGARAVIIANHLSFIDGVLLAAFLPGRPAFAIDTRRAAAWWIKPFLGFVDAVPIDPAKPFAAKILIRAVEQGRRCVIFPEGRITVTGALMKIHEGPAMIADKAHAALLPVRLNGPQFTRFSRLKGKLRRRSFPKVTIAIEEPREIRLPPEIKGRRRRHEIGRRLYDVMSAMMFATADIDQTLFAALLEARAVHGSAYPVIEDIERRPLSYERLIAGSFVLARRLKSLAAPGERVGLLLPNAAATAASFFALHAAGAVPAMLNYSAGAGAMASACRLADIRTIITSRRFVERARLEPAVATLGSERRILFLEDMRATIGVIERLSGLVRARFARHILRGTRARPDDPAVVLFTSGSEGTPKGVVLSHRNILANCRQIAARVDFSPSDVAFNALPLFHAFGLTGGLVLPLINGVRVFLYPSPLHYRIVPMAAYDTNATILFGTDTFLAGYARLGNPYDFYNVRYVFAGAEKVREETRRQWMERFGLRLLEGYGATETSPVLATNTAMHFKAGTVGRMLPGIATRLEPVEGLEGRRLFVSGPNVMLGYLDPERPGALLPPPGGWYDTGDIVTIDGEGYLTILGRAKRFAKIGGEMVSLGAAEALAAAVWPEAHHAVITLPDPRKGEQLLLVTEAKEASVDALLAAARQRGTAEIAVPRTLLTVPTLPLLATGKPDYLAVRGLVEGQRKGDGAIKRG